MMGWLRHLLQERTLEFYLLLALLWLLPALAVGGFGIAYLWQLGWLRWFGLAVLALALLTLAVRWLRPPRTPQAVATEAQIEANAAWSERDLEVWNNAQRQIVAGGILDSPWEAVPDAMLEQVKFVARAYHERDRDAEYAFTVPELLLMLDAARRASAHKVIAVIPYYGYGRQDRKDRPRVPIAARMFLDVISAVGVDRIICMDLHTSQIQGFANFRVSK